MNSIDTANTVAINSKKPSTKQEMIAANIKLLIEQLEVGHSEALTNYLTAMSRFHHYSFGNVMEIARQMPTATRVAGFWTWKNMGRNVKAGQKGIRILAPIVGVRRKKDSEANKDITKQNERVLVGFRNAYVFDISQTEGVDLPQVHEVSGDPGENIDRLAAFVQSKGIQLIYKDDLHGALGASYGGRIAILSGQSKAEEFSCLVHETAHELLHRAERRTATTKTVRETEAEAVVFVVGKAVGLVTGSASADYIQLYHGNALLLAESLEVIQQTASVILAGLEPPIEEDRASQELERSQHERSSLMQTNHQTRGGELATSFPMPEKSRGETLPVSPRTLFQPPAFARRLRARIPVPPPEPAPLLGGNRRAFCLS